MTYPAQCEPGGFMISGLDAPSLNERAFCPGELRDDLFNRFPNYRFSPPGLGDLMRAGRIDDAVAAWLQLIETQTAAAEYLIASRPVDFFMTVYTASDWAGHNLWTDSGASPHDNKLLRIYRALDGAIERLLNCAKPETQVYVISDHGMGPHTGASYHLAEWLEASGRMVRLGHSQARRSILRAGRKAARSLLPVSVRERVKSGMGEARVGKLQAAEKDFFYSSIDWTRTVAYTEPGRHVINVNLEGRNGAGNVPPSEYDKVCARIIEELSQWTDDRGVKVVSRVVHRDDVYSGPFTERASDLYVYWNPRASFGKPPEEVSDRGFWWNGDHRPEGILICKGPGVRSSALGTVPGVCDLVPTTLYAAGVPVPDHIDGRVIQEMFTAEFVAEHPVRLRSAGPDSVSNQVKLSPEEERMVEDKLRGLGYL
jgi:predicted AlkP superfamily phosphohydrolase/phosphomutase